MSDATIVARFENGDPALVEWRSAKGRCTCSPAAGSRATANWPARGNSCSWCRRCVEGAARQVGPRVLRVNEPVPLGEVRHRIAADIRSRSPTAASVNSTPTRARLPRTDQPGHVHAHRRRQAADLRRESRPAGKQHGRCRRETLEQFGCRLVSQTAVADAHASANRLHDVQLESRQKLWQWLIVAALGVLVTETWLAGRATKPAQCRRIARMNFELRQKLERVAGRIRSLRSGPGWPSAGWPGRRSARRLFAIGARDWNTASRWWLEVAALALVSAFIVCGCRAALGARPAGRRAADRGAASGAGARCCWRRSSKLPRRAGTLGYLQKAVVCEARGAWPAHNWTTTVGGWRLGAAQAGSVPGAGAARRRVRRPGRPRQARIPASARRCSAGRPAADCELRSRGRSGQLEIERGTSLLVVAEFPRAVPPDATLVVTTGRRRRPRSRDEMTPQPR